MGVIRNNFIFLTGTVCGVYIAQNYNVPNIKKVANNTVSMLKQIEETYRKPKRREDGDD